MSTTQPIYVRLRALGAPALRYAIGGTLATAIYMGLTLFASGPLGVPIQVAIPISYALALVVHFTLQRRFVFPEDEGYALATHHQAGRYLASAGVQYVLTALSTHFLPEITGLDEQVVYVLTVMTLACLNFLFFRTFVFHE